MKNKLAMTIRLTTVAPIPALALVLIMWLVKPELMGNAWHCATMIFCLSVLPLLAYPVWYIIPALRAKGRKSQRKLAVIFSVVGYLILLLLLFIDGSTDTELLICLTYVISGILIGVLSYIIKFKPSGHACGVAGPMAMLVFKVSPWYALGVIILGLVWWSSLVTKRHTLEQLGVGSLIPVFSMSAILMFLI